MFAEVLSVVARSLSSVLERVWVNFFMIIIAMFIPEQSLAQYSIASSVMIVFAITTVVLLIRDLLINMFALQNSVPTTEFGRSQALADQKYTTGKKK